MPHLSAQLKGTVGQWFYDLRKEYGRRPSWEEFKKELCKKFIDSSTRITYVGPDKRIGRHVAIRTSSSIYLEHATLQ